MFKAPKGITSHPAVLEVRDGFDEGFDYRYDVELKPGWRFASGRMDGCIFARFHTVQDFKDTKIVKVK